MSEKNLLKEQVSTKAKVVWKISFAFLIALLSIPMFTDLNISVPFTARLTSKMFTPSIQFNLFSMLSLVAVESIIGGLAIAGASYAAGGTLMLGFVRFLHRLGAVPVFVEPVVKAMPLAMLINCVILLFTEPPSFDGAGVCFSGSVLLLILSVL